jgi:hypothetical protein
MRFYHVMLLLSSIFLLVGCSDNYLIISGNSSGNFSGGNGTNNNLWYIYTPYGPLFPFIRTNYSVWINNSLDIYGITSFYGGVSFLGGGPYLLDGPITQAASSGINEFNRDTYAPHICDNSGSGNGWCINETQLRVTGTCAPGSSIKGIGINGNVTCELDTEGTDTYVQSISITENGNIQNISLYQGESHPYIWTTFIDNNTATNTYIGNRSTQNLFWEQEFLTASASVFDPFLGAAVSSGTIVAQNGIKDHPGIVSLRDSTTANGGYTITTDSNAISIKGNETSTFIFTDVTTKTNTTTILGYTDSKSIVRPTDGCFLHLKNHVIKGTCINNSIAANTTTSYTIPSRTRWYKGYIETNVGATSVRFSLYNSTTNLLIWNNTLTTRIPTATGRETGWGAQSFQPTTDAAADIIYLDYMSLSMKRTIYR